MSRPARRRAERCVSPCAADGPATALVCNERLPGKNGRRGFSENRRGRTEGSSQGTTSREKKIEKKYPGCVTIRIASTS